MIVEDSYMWGDSSVPHIVCLGDDFQGNVLDDLLLSAMHLRAHTQKSQVFV